MLISCKVDVEHLIHGILELISQFSDYLFIYYSLGALLFKLNS
jgi:hypothetical protein